jgi:hypothetical protein
MVDNLNSFHFVQWRGRCDPIPNIFPRVSRAGGVAAALQDMTATYQARFQQLN